MSKQGPRKESGDSDSDYVESGGEMEGEGEGEREGEKELVDIDTSAVPPLAKRKVSVSVRLDVLES